MLSKSPIKYFAKVAAGQGAPQRETDFSEKGIPFIRAGWHPDNSQVFLFAAMRLSKNQHQC